MHRIIGEALNKHADNAEQAINAAVQQQQAAVGNLLHQPLADPAHAASADMFREITEEGDAALMGPSFLLHSSEALSLPSQISPALPSAAQASAAPSTASLASPQAVDSGDPLADPASNEAAWWAAWEQAEAEAEAAEAAGAGGCISSWILSFMSPFCQPACLASNFCKASGFSLRSATCSGLKDISRCQTHLRQLHVLDANLVEDEDGQSLIRF